jgi:hypothetical protein
MAPSLRRVLGGRRLDQYVQAIIRAKTDFVARQANDAGIAGAKHLNLRSAAQAKLAEPVNVIGMAHDLNDVGKMTGGEAMKRNGF